MKRKRAKEIRAITREEFRARTAAEPYWNGRERYIGEALRMALEPFEDELLRTALEVGPHTCQLLVGADTMDINPELEPTWLHDAGVEPWPIPTDYYDVTLALGVWEHLRGRQRTAFAELARCSRAVVVSFPILWDVAADNCHHGITRPIVDHWTLGCRPVEECFIPAPGRDRLILRWEF